MRVVVAPDSFGGTLGATAAAEAIAAGWRRAAPGDDLALLPLADGGGPGFVEVLHTALGGTRHERVVTGPFGDPVRAAWLLVGATAYVESAAACGLHLVPRERRTPDAAGRVPTRGVGELVAAARDDGAREIVVGLGARRRHRRRRARRAGCRRRGRARRGAARARGPPGVRRRPRRRAHRARRRARRGRAGRHGRGQLRLAVAARHARHRGRAVGGRPGRAVPGAGGPGTGRAPRGRRGGRGRRLRGRRRRRGVTRSLADPVATLAALAEEVARRWSR